jgi:hypothetical protein
MDMSGITDMNGDYGHQDSPPPSPPPQRSSPRRKSFAQIDQDLDGPGDDEEQQEEEQQESPPRTDKGKRKAHLEHIEEEEQIEDEIALGLNDFENEQSEEEEQARSPPPKKKQRVAEEPRKPKPSKSMKENRG